MSDRVGRRGAFTLLEVMAAVLVLGLLYAVLAEAAIRGLRSEGVSRRRVEASLIADLALADIEEQIALGKPPRSGSEEESVDGYRVVRAVQPFDPTPMLEAITAIEKQRGTPARKPHAMGQRQAAQSGKQAQGGRQAGPAGASPGPADPAPVQDLLAPPRTGEDGRLRRIDVSVAWQDGDREDHVLRTTFAFDTTGLESLFPQKSAGEGGGAGQLQGGGPGGVPDPSDLMQQLEAEGSEP
jgi:prepilin-type N-terminal cleavage/methylation domain-containing protein